MSKTKKTPTLKPSTFLTFLGLPLFLTSLWAQSVPFGPATDGVYLLAATPSGRFSASFGAELYRFDAAGKLSLVREIVGTDPEKKEELGVDFVLADYVNRVLIIGSPKLRPTRLDMVSMDSPTAPINRTLQLPDQGAVWEPWPANVARDMDAALGPGAPFRPSLMKVRLMDDGVRSVFLEYGSKQGSVNVAIPITAVGFGAQKYVFESARASLRMSGGFGVGELGYTDGEWVRTPRGRVVYGRNNLDLGVPAPTLNTVAPIRCCQLLVHNKQMSVLREVPPPSSTQEEGILHVWTAASAKWTQFRVPGSVSNVKSIGTWVLGTATSYPNGRKSPGKAERKKNRNATDNKKLKKPRPDTDDWFEAMAEYAYYPGVLFAIDTATGKNISLTTNQGDSEILLIRDDNVIYRVNDALYTARIQSTTVGTPQLVAQDEAIPDMHWAFSSRQ